MAIDDLPIVGLAADLVCPERCAACESSIDPKALFCRPCDASAHRLGPPECVACGMPTPRLERCAACGAAAAPIRMARAFAAYDRDTGADPVAVAIARLKYGGARRLGRRFAAALVPRVPDPRVDVVVPVPLHPRRLRARGFNQSALVARHLARALGSRALLTAVVRRRDTPSQVGLGSAERARNVEAAFAVVDRATVAGRTALVVDDVWTSGATVREVARARCPTLGPRPSTS